MKRVLVVLICLSFSFHMMAQEVQRQKEIGITLSSLNSFGITYRVGTEKALWRFNTMYLNGNLTETVNEFSEENISEFYAGINIGREWRSRIHYQLEFRAGADLSFAFNTRTFETFIPEGVLRSTQKTRNYIPGINAMIGLNYLINDVLVLGAEIMPLLSYRIEKIESIAQGNVEISTDRNVLSFGASNTSARLSLVYRF